MRIVSWNVNGLRACAKKGFLQVLQRHKIDVMALQEVRAFPEQLPDKVLNPRGWHANFAPAKRPGYSGVAIYSRVPPTRIESSLDEPRFDDEGRFCSPVWSFNGRQRIFQRAVAKIVTTVVCPTKWTFIERYLIE